MEQLFKHVACFTDIHYGLKQNSRLHLDDCHRFVDWFIAESKVRGCETCIFLGDWHHHRASVNVATMNASIKDLRNKFNKVNASGEKRDIGNLAEQKPKLMQRAINRGTKNALRCMEIAMGSPLTEKEKNAVKKSQINPECPDVANPNYVPYGN